MKSRDALKRAVAKLDPISLGEVLDQAELQTRTDTKYILGPDDFARLATLISADVHALEIDGRRAFRYDSVYFDTPDFLTFRQHRQGRPRRFKVRTRTYVDSGDCTFEIKMEGTEGETIKERLPYDACLSSQIAPEQQAHLRRTLENYGMSVPGGLCPSLSTSYTRATLVGKHGGVRVTCDVDWTATSPSGEYVEGLRDRIIVEVKADGTDNAVTRAIDELGLVEESVSKYCIAVAMLNPGIIANPWHGVLRRHFGWQPQTCPSPSSVVK